MARIVRPPSGASLRQRALRRLRQALQWPGDPGSAKDRQAYALEQLTWVNESVRETLEAWEKREYWVKAERFRIEWAWAATLEPDLERALAAEDDGLLSETLAQLLVRLVQTGVRADQTLQPEAWRGAWKRLEARLTGHR